MGRKKVNLQWITNKATRRATYKRRSQVLIKKASELTTLCDIKACVVVYGEDAEDAQPKVWPSAAEATRLFKQYKEMPDSFKKSTDQLQYLGDRIIRVREQVKKLEAENCHLEASALLHEHMIGCRPGLVGATEKEVLNLKDMVDVKMSKVKARLQQLADGQGAQPLPPAPAPNGGDELGAVVYGAFAGSSSTGTGGGGASGSGSKWTWG